MARWAMIIRSTGLGFWAIHRPALQGRAAENHNSMTSLCDNSSKPQQPSSAPPNSSQPSSIYDYHLRHKQYGRQESRHQLEALVQGHRGVSRSSFTQVRLDNRRCFRCTDLHRRNGTNIIAEEYSLVLAVLHSHTG